MHTEADLPVPDDLVEPDDATGSPSADAADAAPGQGKGPSSSRRRVLPWLPVIAWVLFVTVLGIAKVSGSSLSQYGDGNRPALGMSRPIRSDEFFQRTPLVVRQAELDFPSHMQVGMGTHSAGILSDLPVKAWTAALRPQTIPYFVLDVERGFAFEWWLIYTAPFVGVYALMLVLTRRVVLSTLTGAAVALSPAGLWWTVPTMGLSIGWSAAAAAAFLAAGRARQRWASFAFAALAGYALAALAVLIYIPWVLPMALVFATTVVGTWLARADRPSRSTLLTILGVAGGTAAVLVGAFIIRERDAISAILGSAYPGSRRSESGAGNLATLFSGPFDYFAGAQQLVSVNGTNQSEAAIGMMLWVPVLIAEGTLWTWRRSADAVRRVLSMLMMVLLLLFAWCVLPVPPLIGRILKLDIVPATRMYLPLTVGGIVLVALFAHVRQTERRSGVGSDRPQRERFRLAAGFMIAATAWGGLALRIEGAPISRAWVTVIALVIGAITYVLLDGKLVVGLVAVVLFTAFSSLRINPVQVGMQPLLAAPLMSQIDDVRSTVPDPTGSWLLVGLDVNAYGPLAASGVPLLSGFSMYADADAWAVLDPQGQAEVSWNRLGLVQFGLSADDAAPTISTPQADVITVDIGACRPELTTLDARFVVSTTALESPCLTQLLPAPTAPGQFWVYERTAPSQP